MTERPKTLYRSSVELSTEGRTLVGIAARWETPAWVRDPGKQRYLEALARTSCDVTLRNHPDPFPLFETHGWLRGESPVGVARYKRSEEGLLFVAEVSRTRGGDDALQLVKDGALRSVSIGMMPVKERRHCWPQGEGVMRTEVRLRELSLAPTGFGQYPEAKVLSVRATSLAERRALFVRRIETEQHHDARLDASLVRCGVMTPSEMVTRTTARAHHLADIKRKLGIA